MFYLIYSYGGAGYIKKFSSLREVQKNMPSREFCSNFMVFYELSDSSFISVQF